MVTLQDKLRHRKTITVRISQSLSTKAHILALSGVVALSSFVLAPMSPLYAQDASGKTDTEAPADAATNFGPRKGAQAAQGEQPPADALKTEIISTHGSWQVQCTEVPKGADPGQPDGGKTCGMVQNIKSDKDDKIQISLIISKVKRGDKSSIFVRVLAPIGVYLPTGVPVEIDGAALPNRMQFTRCLPRVCEAFGEATPESLNKFKKGGVATFYIYDRPGNGFPMKIKLEGFDAALADLNKT